MADTNHSPSKVCSRCKIEKPRSEFFKASCCKDGLRGECKQCVAEKQKIYNVENAERIAAKKKETYHSEENKPKMVERRAAYYVANCERIKKASRAYHATSAAIDDHLKKARSVAEDMRKKIADKVKVLRNE